MDLVDRYGRWALWFDSPSGWAPISRHWTRWGAIAFRRDIASPELHVQRWDWTPPS